jgi:hypothetical protein
MRLGTLCGYFYPGMADDMGLGAPWALLHAGRLHARSFGDCVGFGNPDGRRHGPGCVMGLSACRELACKSSWDCVGFQHF